MTEAIDIVLESENKKQKQMPGLANFANFTNEEIRTIMTFKHENAYKTICDELKINLEILEIAKKEREYKLKNNPNLEKIKNLRDENKKCEEKISNLKKLNDLVYSSINNLIKDYVNKINKNNETIETLEKEATKLEVFIKNNDLVGTVKNLQEDKNKLFDEYNDFLKIRKEYILYHFNKYYRNKNNSHYIHEYKSCDHHSYEKCDCRSYNNDVKITYDDLIELIKNNKINITVYTSKYSNAMCYECTFHYYEAEYYGLSKTLTIYYKIIVYNDENIPTSDYNDN